MRLDWIQESPPYWDRDKARIVGESPGAFGLGPYRDGDLLPGEWWRVEDGGSVLGYPEGLTLWLEDRGFRRSHADRLLRRTVTR